MTSGLVLGVAMLVSSTGVSPALETTSSPLAPPAFIFELPRLAGPLDAAHPLAGEHLRPVWRRGTLPPAQSRPVKRFSPTDRIIAVAAGVAVGWVAGGAIGYKLTDNPDNPDDDASGLRGVIVGAPLGAAVGAILGWRLTDR